MFKNHLKTAFRSLLKNKVITIITVLGLSIGISTALVIYQIVQYDYSFDRFEPDRDRIYRVVTEGPEMKNPGVPPPLYQAAKDKIAGITASTAFFDYWSPAISILQDNNQMPKVLKKQEGIIFTDSNYFKIFPHTWIAGSASGSLNTPYHVVLTQSRAQLYFPNLSVKEIMGKEIIFNDSISASVSGIVKDLAVATDFDNKVFISLSTIPHSGLKQDFYWGQWGSTVINSKLILKLASGVSPKQIEKQIASVYNPHILGTGYNSQLTHILQPLKEIHFNKDFGGTASKSTLRNLILLAVILLLLGAINFINLSTAQASQRAKDIGVRRTLGSSRSQLIGQFMTETFLMTLLATVVSVLLIPFLLNIFSGYIPKGLTYGGIGHLDMLLFLLVLVITVSLLSGLYPALILSRLKPLTVIRNQVSSRYGKTRNTWVRKTLIISQFVIAQVFIISVLMVNKQIRYSLDKDMGIRKDGIIVLDIPTDFYFSSPDHKRYVLLDKLRDIPEISAVSLSAVPAVFNDRITTNIRYSNKGDLIKITADVRKGDTSFLHLYGIRLLAGRNVLPTDSATELLINKTLAYQLGFQHLQDALGHFIEYKGRQMSIVGVMGDFNGASLRRSIHPMIYYTDTKQGFTMSIALSPNTHLWNSTVSQIHAAWKSVYPDKDFDYTFLDKTIENFYKQDIKLSKLLAWSAGIAIFIGCLGLLGLVIFTANQRTKEIGIRKVLGASVTQIIALLSKDFIALVILAFVIAVPIAWITMNKWLQHFAYHTALSWWIFILSGLAMLILSLVILGLRAGRAARVNPVESLRAE